MSTPVVLPKGMIPQTINNISLIKMGSIQGLDLNGTGVTTIPFLEDYDFTNHSPALFIVKNLAGTTASATIDVGGNGVSFGSNLSLLAMNGTHPATIVFIKGGTWIPNSGNLEVNVVVGSGGAATVDIDVYGFKL